MILVSSKTIAKRYKLKQVNKLHMIMMNDEQTVPVNQNNAFASTEASFGNSLNALFLLSLFRSSIILW